MKYEIWKREKSTEAWDEFKKSRKNSKMVIWAARGHGRKHKEKKPKEQKQEEKKQEEHVTVSDLNDLRHQNKIFWIAKQMVKERWDITGSNCLKGVSGKVIVDEKEITESWKEYMEKLMNEENEWDHRISAEVKEGPADCIRIDKIAAAVKRMKSPKPQVCQG